MPKVRASLQVSLSTLVVMVLLIGIVLYMNLLPYDPAAPILDRGWPFVVLKAVNTSRAFDRSKEVSTEIGIQEYVVTTADGRRYECDTSVLNKIQILNIMLAIASLTSVGIAIEYALKRRAAVLSFFKPHAISNTLSADR